mgnify:CR=1 FL=1
MCAAWGILIVLVILLLIVYFSYDARYYVIKMLLPYKTGGYVPPNNQNAGYRGYR